MQLDIFEHSRDALPPLAVLVATLERLEDAPFADHAAAAAALGGVQRDIEPAARRLWGAQAGAVWLAPLWPRFARRTARLRFRAEHAESHAAALRLKAGDFAAAADAVSKIDSWRHIPAPLAWMGEARFRLDGLDASWGLLAEIAWLSPQRFDALTRRLADPVLTRLRRQFDAEFEGDGHIADLAWFPDWVLCEKPALATWLGHAQSGLESPPERAMRLLLFLGIDALLAAWKARPSLRSRLGPLA